MAVWLWSAWLLSSGLGGHVVCGIPADAGCVRGRAKCEVVGKAKIALWYQDARSATSLTFDDSLPSQYKYLVPLLKEYNYRGTFFLNTVDLEKKKPNIWRQSLKCWPHWKKTRDLGHEIGSHTVNHPNLAITGASQVVRELRDSCRTIRRRVENARCHTLAYPYGMSNRRVRRLVRRYYIAARGAKHRIASHTPRDMMNVPSVTPYQKTTHAVMSKWVKQSLKRRGWLVWMFHGTRRQGWEALPLTTYRFIFEELKKHDKRFWVAPFGEVARYVYLRKEVQIKLADRQEKRLVFRLTRRKKYAPRIVSSLLESARDHRLTAKVWVPSSWADAVRIRQGEQTLSILSRRTGRCGCGQELTFDLSPKNGDIEVEHRPNAKKGSM
ncbi:MAG: polysaccharide deacetylase family protein [Myxococcales bacterium]|nr:polysaccharide deacetylase family protein [Myxococcales bacterium]MCB9642659.1 polysaccharide deacetylase family protein [Myxococcales bacterium]